MALCLSASAQRYDGIVNKTVALVGNEVVTIADIENEVRVAGAQGMASDRTLRCNILENLMTKRVENLHLHGRGAAL